MLLYTAEQSKRLDQLSEEAGVSTQTLMANAGKKIAQIILEQAKPKEGPIVFLIGKGNNGGDGLVAAKYLSEKKYETVQIQDEEDLRKYAIDKGEPATISGRQEYYENIINRFI